MGNEHPLLSAKLLAVLAILGFGDGLAVALILAAKLSLIGVLISLICSAAIVWLYWQPLKQAVTTGRWDVPNMPSPAEIAIVSVCFLAGPFLACYLYTRGTEQQITAADIAGEVIDKLTAENDPDYLGRIVSTLNNDQLARVTHKFANGMRDAEVQDHVKIDSIFETERRCTYHLPENDPRLNTCFRNGQEAMINYENIRQAEFRRKFLPSAQALRTELQRRTGSTLQTPDQGHSALDDGMLAGPSPMSEVADYLDALARELPHDRKQN